MQRRCVVAVMFLTLLGGAGGLVAADAKRPWLYCEANRLRYVPGQEAVFDIRLTNPTSSVVEGVLRLDVVSELDRVEPVDRRKVRVEAGGDLKWKATWRVPEDRKWGHAATAVWVDGQGAERLRRSAFFTVGHKGWQVGHWTSWCHLGGLSSEDIRRLAVGTTKRWLCTAADYFSWQPSGWETMDPEIERWRTGQTKNPEGRKEIRTFIEQCHEQGIEVYSYLQGASWGPAGLEWIRAHPEFWNFDRHGRPFPGKFVYNVDSLAVTRTGKGGGKRHMFDLWARTGGLWNDEMKQYLFDQLAASVKTFGWDGFRSDGLPYPGNAYDYTGRYHRVVSDDRDDVLVAWFKELRQKLREIDPNCSLHFNAGAVAYHAGRNSKRLFQAKAADSMVLWESGHYVEREGWDLADLDTYIRYLHKEVAPAREVGGYRHVGYTRYGSELVEAATTACGGKVSLVRGRRYYKKGPLPWRTFTFRFGRYFWDADLRHVPEAAEFFNVRCGPKTRWKDLVQVRREADGRTYYMVHLINLAQPYKPKRKYPAPPPDRNVTLTLRGREAGRVRRVVALTCDGGTERMSRELRQVQEGETVTAILPELKVWTVVVFELAADG